MDEFSDGIVELDRQPVLQSTARFPSGPVLVYAVALLASAGMLLYAVTRSFVWDEGFHLVAAQLIAAGKRPYLDFCFPQTPLNAYWNAAWFRLFGQNWRVPHVAAALLLIGCLTLLTHYLLSRFPIPRWRTPATIAALLLFSCNATLVQFGPIAQAYAMCIFGTFAAFRLSTKAVERETPAWAFLAGLFASIAAASSLLSAPVSGVLLVWLFLQNRNGSRLAKLAAFGSGSAIPFIPVLWLFMQAPRQVFFNIIQYQTLFRRADWATATEHDVDVLTSWSGSSPALCLSLFAIAGTIFAARRTDLGSRIRRELYLCAWISAALIAYISTAHPTFVRYYIIAIPFLAVLAAHGFYFSASRLFSPEHPGWPAFSLAVITVVALFHALYNDRDAATWQRYEEIASKVASVTPQNARLFADEQVYFLLKRAPPPGMEFSYSHKLQLPPSEETALHIISEKELQQQLKAGGFKTFESCNDDRIDDWGIAKIYKSRADISDCSVFWDYLGEKN